MAAEGPGDVQLGSTAPDFALPEVTDGSIVRRDDLTGDVLVVMFLSRHCPYVQHVQDQLAELAREYTAKDVSFVGICANDAQAYPDDAADSLAEQKAEAGFEFPYVRDDAQDVSKAYGAACTPEFFVYDEDRLLVYRGRMDASRPGQGTPTGSELRTALSAALEGAPVPEDQVPSIGCGIKWLEGNEPE
ncbi:MAG: thioredoxin family protein [Nitriliruptoraceae bacterium]